MFTLAVQQHGHLLRGEHKSTRAVPDDAADRSLLHKPLGCPITEITRVNRLQAVRVPAAPHRPHPGRQGLLRGWQHLQGQFLMEHYAAYIHLPYVNTNVAGVVS